MNEEHKKRGFASSKTLMTAAICALFLGGGQVIAHAAEAPVVQEVQQTTNITVTVVDSRTKCRSWKHHRQYKEVSMFH